MITAVNVYIILKKDRYDRTASGIYLPPKKLGQTETGEPYSGIVLSVGDEVSLVKEKDHVVFCDTCQPLMMFDHEDTIIILRECDIIGILEDGE